MNQYPEIKLGKVSIDENIYTDGDMVWMVPNLIEKSKNLPVFDLPIAAIHSGGHVWGDDASPYAIAEHVKRAMDVDTSHPVIMCQRGFIMDGWHRVLRALIDGVPTIKAVRFEKTPQFDYKK